MCMKTRARNGWWPGEGVCDLSSGGFGVDRIVVVKVRRKGERGIGASVELKHGRRGTRGQLDGGMVGGQVVDFVGSETPVFSSLA